MSFRDERYCSARGMHLRGRILQEGDEMSGNKILAIVLIVLGLLGVLYGKFSYTKETHEAKLGPIEMSVKEKQTVNVPAWAGVAAIAAGAALLLVRKKS